VGMGVLAVCGAFTLLFGIYLARSIARPVCEGADGATRLDGGDLTTRLPVGGPKEVSELATAFKAMASSLEQNQAVFATENEQLRESDRLKSEPVSIVSHELRTPVTTILGFTNGL